MLDRDQQLMEAARHYTELLKGDRLVSIADYVASVDPDLREELAPYLELLLAVGHLDAPAALTLEEQALTERAAAHLRERWKERTAAARPQTLTQGRTARKLSLAAVARQINLPVDLLARIERGGVDVATIPDRLVARLAGVLGRAAADIQASFSAPTIMPSGVRLSADQSTVARPERVVSFAEALAQSSATESQREEWS